jgi:hypothetical protein
VQTNTPVTTTFASPFSHPSIGTSIRLHVDCPHPTRFAHTGFHTIHPPDVRSSDPNSYHWMCLLHPHASAVEPVKTQDALAAYPSPHLSTSSGSSPPQRLTSSFRTCTYNRGSQRRAPDFGTDININNTNDLYIRIDSPVNINIVHPRPDTSPSIKSLVTPFAFTPKYERRIDLPAYLPQPHGGAAAQLVTHHPSTLF